MIVYLMKAGSTESFPDVDKVIYFFPVRPFRLDFSCISRTEWENQGGE